MVMVMIVMMVMVMLMVGHEILPFKVVLDNDWHLEYLYNFMAGVKPVVLKNCRVTFRVLTNDIKNALRQFLI